ncbi:hypothetical protein ACXR2U_23585 [Jatrophihabitans sp. YIM 134969]
MTAPTTPAAPVVPLRPMSAADVLDGGFRLVRAAPAAVLVPALLAAVVVTVADTALRLWLDSGATLTVDDEGLPTGSVFTPVFTGLFRQLLGSVVTTVAVAVVGAFVAGVLVCTLAGRRATLGAVWAIVRGRLFVAAVVGVVVGVAQAVALLFLVAPGVWLWALLALAAPAVVVERASVTGALRRTTQLVGRGFWRVLGLRLLAALSALAFGYLFRVPFTLLADQVADSDTARAGFLALGTLLTSAVVLPLRAGVDVMLYLDQRIRREAFDVVLTLGRAGA